MTWTSVSMLSSACFVPTLYNHHLLRERRLFHAPKTHSLCMQNIRFIGGPRVLDCKSMGWCWCSVLLDCEKRKLPLADAWAATEILWNVRLRSLVVQHGIRNEQASWFPTCIHHPISCWYIACFCIATQQQLSMTTRSVWCRIVVNMANCSSGYARPRVGSQRRSNFDIDLRE
jgi:hypothetical protein